MLYGGRSGRGRRLLRWSLPYENVMLVSVEDVLALRRSVEGILRRLIRVKYKGV